MTDETCQVCLVESNTTRRYSYDDMVRVCLTCRDARTWSIQNLDTRVDNPSEIKSLTRFRERTASQRENA